MPAKRIVVVSIDRLNAGYLGPWGNTWVETPALDSLAAKSFLWDRALIDSPSLANIFHGLWNGRHAVGLPASGVKPGQRHASLPQRLAAEGYSTVLLHDEPALAQHPLHDDWQQTQQLTVPAPTKLAAEISSSYWSEFFGTAISLLEQAPQRSVVWLHSGALNTLWDAPLELREHYNDPEDPPPQDNAQVPRLVLPADYDPDLLLEISHAYAAQIGMLDTCLEALGEAIDERPDASDTLFVLLGTRGMPLGEHRRVGAWDDRLYAELVQTPLLVSWPERFRSPGRSDELAQLPDLFPTLLEAAGAETREHQFSRSLWPTVDMRPAAVVRDRACLTAPLGERAIHTAWWSLRFSEGAQAEPDPATANQSERELFVKPDDRFEVNNVARRCDAIADELQQAWEATVTWAIEANLMAEPGSTPPPLAEIISDEPQ